MTALAAFTAPTDSVLAWQKIKKHLANASPAAQLVFKGLREFLVTQRANPLLQVATFSKAGLTTAGGVPVGAGTAQVYGIYFKKDADDTDAWFNLVDNGTDDAISGLSASYIYQVAARIASKETIGIFPTGLDVLLGLRFVTNTTGAAGVTISVAAADSVDGFVLYGVA